jgi:hypothetical protein
LVKRGGLEVRQRRDFAALEEALFHWRLNLSDIAPITSRNVDGEERCRGDRVGPVAVRLATCPSVDPGDPGVSFIQAAIDFARLRAASPQVRSRVSFGADFTTLGLEVQTGSAFTEVED